MQGKKKKKKPSDLIALNDHPRLFFFKAMGIHQKPLQTTTIENKICVYIYIYDKRRVEGGCGCGGSERWC